MTNSYEPFYVDPSKVNRSKHTGASSVLADLNRAQWNDWKARFQPRLEQLAKYAESGELTHKAIGIADESMGQSFNQARTNQQMQNQSLGINQSAAQKNTYDRTMGLAQASSTAAARNQARIAGQDRDMQILAGGSAGLTQDLG